MGNPAADPLVVFANREPYIHMHSADGVEVLRPASGLVSALEPVLKRRGGLWIAHGSGSADAEHSDPHGELVVPPEDPSYRLKRVWLSPAEKKSYYDGFSNEALWPLFHLAHHQPTFRRTDWEGYIRVNERFAESLELAADGKNRMILVQDFHLALVPRMLRDRLGATPASSRIGFVWHIPWVPADIFRICPWAKEILIGILGADLVTFHAQSYCINFLESCDRLLECRVDRERQSVTHQGHETRIRSIPIGIDAPEFQSRTPRELRRRVAEKFGVNPEILALGVDRLDYTKGIPQRFLAVERFLELNPSLVGRFTLLQIASPSRTDVPAYQRFGEGVVEEADRINSRFERQIGPEGSPAIRLVGTQQDWNSLELLYQAADLCLVTSLHDGMNLVAKEYLWSRSTDTGALLLSRFAGASQELEEAFLVNPYDIEDSAATLALALATPEIERRERMQRLRRRVMERTAQDWANEVLAHLSA